MEEAAINDCDFEAIAGGVQCRRPGCRRIVAGGKVALRARCREAPKIEKAERRTIGPRRRGPGTELWTLFKRLGIQEKPGCGCRAKAAEMDHWGTDGCRQHFDEIVAWLRDGLTRYGWREKLAAAAAMRSLKQIDWRDPLPSILHLAIRRVELRELLPLVNSLVIEPRVRLDARVVTAADAGFFLPLKLLVVSLRQTHDCPISVIDLGLSNYQLAWLRRHAVEIHDCPPPVYPIGEPQWQNWNKPEYLKLFLTPDASRLTPLLWLDADILVTGSLAELVDLARERPVMTPCYAARLFWGDDGEAECLRNREPLYERYPVPRRLDAWPNNGVIALDPIRDRELLDRWSFMCAEAGRDPSLREHLRFFDQGAIQWAMESTGITELLPDKRWNDPDLQGERTAAELAAAIDRSRESDTRVMHFAGDRKPYGGLGSHPCGLPIDLTPADLTVFVPSHLRHDLATVADLPWIQKIYLPDIDADNDLAEGRLFLPSCRALDKCKSEYVGVAAPHWNRKYRQIARTIEHLHRLHYAPHIIYAGCRAPEDWPEESDRQHPGMAAAIAEMAAHVGLKDAHRPSVWNNNFVCHRDVMLDFLRFWRELYPWCRVKWPTIPFDNRRHNESDLKRFGLIREYAYLQERFALLFFASRPDLTILQVPPRPTPNA